MSHKAAKATQARENCVGLLDSDNTRCCSDFVA